MSTANTVGLSHGPSPATLPLLSSSLFLFYAFTEYANHRAFLAIRPSDKAQARAIQQWWNKWGFKWGMSTIFTLSISNLVSGIYATRSYNGESTAWKLCAAGTAFNFAHFFFGPSVARIIQNICSEENAEKEKTTYWLEKWQNLHMWRTALADFPAVVCFALVVFYERV